MRKVGQSNKALQPRRACDYNGRALAPKRIGRELRGMVTIRHVVCDRESYFVRDTATAMDAAQYMADRKIGAVCVLDADGKLCGIFSERDLLNRVVVRKLDPAQVPIRDVMSGPRGVIDCK